MTTNHPLIGRKVKTPNGKVFTVVGSIGFQPALPDGTCEDFYVPVIDNDNRGIMMSFTCITVLDDEPAAEDERVAKLRALALLMCGIVASEVKSTHFAKNVNMNKMVDAMSVTGISEGDENDAIIEKALAIIEASR